MNHAGSADHGATATLPFSTQEWDALRAEDYAGAKAIVFLMLGIFSLGVMGYLVVCWSIAG